MRNEILALIGTILFFLLCVGSAHAFDWANLLTPDSGAVTYLHGVGGSGGSVACARKASRKHSGKEPKCKASAKIDTTYTGPTGFVGGTLTWEFPKWGAN